MTTGTERRETLLETVRRVQGTLPGYRWVASEDGRVVRMEPIGTKEFKAARWGAWVPTAPPPEPTPTPPGAGFRELRLGDPLLEGEYRRYAEKAAAWCGDDLGLGRVFVSWYTDEAGRELGWAHPQAPSRIWLRAERGLEPGVAALRAAHEARHLHQYAQGHRPDPHREGHDALLERDADRYALDALGRFWAAQDEDEE